MENILYSIKMFNTIAGVVLYVTFSTLYHVVSSQGTEVNRTVDDSYCSTHCNSNGDMEPGTNCYPLYCCGTEYKRFCCDNATQKVDDEFNRPDRLICPNTWWIFNWQMALGMLGTVILLLTVSACCCQCIAHKTNSRAVARAEAAATSRRRRVSDVATIEMEEQHRREPSFDPSSPFAFVPPGYAKDPPKYQDIYEGTSDGATNLAFTNDHDDINPSISEDRENNRQENTPPPPYTVHYNAHGTNATSGISGIESDATDESADEDDVQLSTVMDEQLSSPRIIRVSSSPTAIDNTTCSQ